MNKWERQRILAMIGGGCLGMLLGAVLGGIVGSYLVSVEPWEDQELYGFIGFARRIREVGIGVLGGGAVGLLTGAWYGARSPQRSP